MGKSEGITLEELAAQAHTLADRMIADPVVSDDMKEMACIVRLLAMGLRDTEECIDVLASRPAGRSININYGK